MSDVDKDEFKREYLPLVNTNSEGRDLTPPHMRDSGNPAVNHNKSVLSDNISAHDNKYSVVKQTHENADPQETFFQKNKKIILISVGVVLGIGAIVGIILAIVLKGGDGPGPDPDNPVLPDPYVYQEFNPFYMDPNSPPEVTTFQGDFYLKFNNSAFPNDDRNQSNNTMFTHRGRNLQDIPHSLRNFLHSTEQQVGDKPVDGTNYRPMNPKYVSNSTNNTWA